MKICRLVLLVTLELGAAAGLEAQTAPPADAILVASQTMPQGAAFFPQLVAAGHNSLLQGLHVNPSITTANSTPPAPVLENPAPPLNGMDRWKLFWNETYASPGAFAGVFVGALADQLRHTPAKWDGDGSAYTRRFASEYGQLAGRNVIHDGLAAATGLDPRYKACSCSGAMHRSAHALKMTFTTYGKDGRLSLDVPQLAGAYGSGMVSTYWYPHQQFSPLVQGIQFGHEQMGEVLIQNLVQEFAPDVKRALHWKALTARVHPQSVHTRSLDDD